MFFTQWGTYYKYSWDIMEPITCLFGVLDLIIAYCYWLKTNSEASYSAFEDDYLNKLVEKDIGGVDEYKDNFHDIVKIIDHIELRKSMEGENLADILYSLDKKFEPIK